MGSRIVAIETIGGILPGQLLIQGLTHSRWSHTWGVTDAGTIIDATIHGVRERRKPIKGYTHIHHIPLDFLSEDDQWELYRIVKGEEGKPYDWRWIIGYLINRDWQDDRYWVCCELYLYAIVRIGIFKNVDDHWITPSQLTQNLLWYRRLWRYGESGKVLPMPSKEILSAQGERSGVCHTEGNRLPETNGEKR